MAIPRRQLYINGVWTKPAQGQTFDVYSPATGSKIGTIPAATAEDVDKAVTGALRAFRSDLWSKQSGAHRAKYLRKIADKVIVRSKSARLAQAKGVSILLCGCQAVSPPRLVTEIH